MEIVKLYKVGQFTFEVVQPTFRDKFLKWIKEMYEVDDR